LEVENERPCGSPQHHRPKSTLEEKYPDGVTGFMSPSDSGQFLAFLEEVGLRFEESGRGMDLAVVDQRNGPTIECDWLQFFKHPIGCSAVALLGAPEMPLATPPGWQFEKSLSSDFIFVPNAEIERRLKFLRHEGTCDVYLDEKINEIVYVGRPF
jgi:hypothetical protein